MSTGGGANREEDEEVETKDIKEKSIGAGGGKEENNGSYLIRGEEDVRTSKQFLPGMYS